MLRLAGSNTALHMMTAHGKHLRIHGMRESTLLCLRTESAESLYEVWMSTVSVEDAHHVCGPTWSQ